MTLLSIAPDIMAGASGDLEKLGSELRSANASAATQTTSIAAPATDEVSAAITAFFGAHAQGFQSLTAKAAAFHDDFVHLLRGGAAQYVSTEAANVQQTLANTVNAPARALLGHPLFGTGQGTAGSAAANESLSGRFGPFQYSLNETATGLNATVTLRTPCGHGPSLSFSATPTSSGEDVNATGTLNTPLGPVKWLTANGTATTSPDGAFQASISAHTLFGPPTSLSVTGTPVSSDGEVGETLTATGTVKTPFGPVDWLSANGTATTSPDGAFQASISAHTLISHEGASVTGTIAGGTPQITGGSISINRLHFSF